MQRRILPPRQSRGRPPRKMIQTSVQEKKHYQDVFEKIEVRGNQAQNDAQNNAVHNYTDMMKSNIINYPFPRGPHYIFSLETLDRVQDCQSYVYDKNILNVNFKQQDINYNGSKLKQLLNRKMFGLPIKPKDHRQKKTKAKNICHTYLFSCQDKKYKIDISITQLKYIIKNLQKLLQTGKLFEYSCVKKDLQLFEMLEDQEITFQEKKQLLEKKLKILWNRKNDMRNGFHQEDKVYFPGTLNQKLFNQMEINQQYFSNANILSQLNKPDRQLQLFNKNNKIQNQTQRMKMLRKMFTFTFGMALSIKQQNLQKLAGEDNYKKIFKQFDIEKTQPFIPYYNINNVILPSSIFDFANAQLLDKTEQIVSQKLYQISDAVFYIFRGIWKKLFNRDVEIKTILKCMTKDQYMQMAIKDIDGLKNQKKKCIEKKLPKDQKIFRYPSLDCLIDFQKLEEDSIQGNSENKELSQFMIFKSFRSISINTKEYMLIAYFHAVYKCLGEFLKSTNNISLNKAENIISSEHYSKIHPYFTNILNNPKFGVIDDVLRKICDLVAQVQQNTNLQIVFEWNSQLGVAFVWTQQQVQQYDSQTKKQDQIEIPSPQHEEIKQHKQVKQIVDMSRPKKKRKRY